MKRFLIIVGLMAAVTIVSCKKDEAGGGDNNNNDARLLTKVTTTENGVSTVYALTYDGNKKLTSIKSSDNVELTTFTYDQAGLLVKIEETSAEFKNVYAYTYTNGVPVSGTFKSWTNNGANLIEDDRLTYTVANEKVTKIHLDMNIAEEESDFTLSYTGDNLTEIKLEESANSSYHQTVNFTFGNKKSPFPQLSKYVLDQAGFSMQFVMKNELLKAKYDLPGTELDRELVYNYTYDSKGYVLTSNDGTAQIKYEYQ